LSVDYGDVRAVASLDLSVAEGETVAVLGPSGSGKSTLLYAIAGFVDLADGSIELYGETVATPRGATPPEQRAVGLVFQNYALWPHLTAEQTVAYPLQRAGIRRREALAQANDLLELLGIGDLAARKPAELSGGQQQRVGLARAMARPARLFLLDEPTAHLDASARAAVQERIAHRRREAAAAAVYATHDSAEALAIADRVAIMRDGSLVQVDTPRRIYERPIDLWAARLTGPAAIVDVEVVAQDAGVLEVALDGTRVAVQTGAGGTGGRVPMLVRPEWVSFGGDLAGVVRDVWFRGPHTDYTIDIAAGPLEARVAGPPQAQPGEHVACTVTRGWVSAG
jgi:ABC-type Fe3+/spermidine/putrescine transport system ATPase subunit